MIINNRDLQSYYRAFIEEKIPSSRKSCPTIKGINNFFKSKTSEKYKTKIVEHITHCSCCLEEFEFILQTSRYEKTLSKEIGDFLMPKNDISNASKIANRILFHPAKKNPLFFHRLSWTYALLLIGAFIAIFSFIFLLDKLQYQHSLKQEDRGNKFTQINLIEPLNRINAKSPIVFKWNDVNDSDYYVLELFDETLILIWKSPKIFINQFILPNEIKKELSRNKAYFWMVTACLPDGGLIESRVEKFYLTN